MKFSYVAALLAAASLGAALPSARTKTRHGNVTRITQDVVDAQGWIVADMDEIYGQHIADASPLVKRDIDFDPFICSGIRADEKRGTHNGTVADINHLDTIPVCGVAAGPRICVRTACSDNTGAWLCNNQDFPIAVACSLVGEDVLRIWTQCGMAYGRQDYFEYTVLLAYSPCNATAEVNVHENNKRY